MVPLLSIYKYKKSALRFGAFLFDTTYLVLLLFYTNPFDANVTSRCKPFLLIVAIFFSNGKYNGINWA